MPLAAFTFRLLTFYRAYCEVRVCLESLCKLSHFRALACKQKFILCLKEAAQENQIERNPGLRAESLSVCGKTRERPAGRAGESGCHGPPGSCLEAASEGALETPLQVQHLQEELNTRLPGQLC